MKPLNKRLCTNKEGEVRSKFYGRAGNGIVGGTHIDEDVLYNNNNNSTTESLPGGKLAYSPNNLLQMRDNFKQG